MKTSLKSILLGVLVGVMLCSCDSSRSLSVLEKNVLKLKPGMTKQEVQQAMSGCKITLAQAGTFPITYDATIFKTNVTNGNWVIFRENGDSFFKPLYEACDVFFDTNEMIVGYRYQTSKSSPLKKKYAPPRETNSPRQP